MTHKIHYQPDFADYTGDGNFEPIACGREEVIKLTHNWAYVTCEQCISNKLKK